MVRKEQMNEFQLEGNVINADTLPLLHSNVERVVALSIGEAFEVVRGARVDEGLAGLQVDAFDCFEEGRVTHGGKVGLVKGLEERKGHANGRLSGLYCQVEGVEEQATEYGYRRLSG